MQKVLYYPGILVLLLIASCGGDDNPAKKKYPLGFTPFPYSTTSIDQVLDYVYEKLSTDANLVSHHFDDGIPWNEALNNQPYPNAITNDWNFRVNNTPASHKVLVSVTPISISRDGLAPYRNNNGGDQPLPSPWDTYAFNAPDVKTAFLNHCKKVISVFNPDYLAIGIESNLLKKSAPSQWDSYVDLHHYVYTELKKLYPALPVFVSFTGFDLAGYTDANQTEQLAALNDLIGDCDYFGLSLHPQFSQFLAEVVPPVVDLQTIFALSSKPIAVCETSYPAQNFSIYGGALMYSGTPQKQIQYFQNLFTACETFDTRFVVNFVLRDYDQLWEEIGSPDDYNKIWRDTGFYDENGTEREVLQWWKSRL